MNNNTVSYIGLLGVGLFALTSIVGGILIDNYSVMSQYISESYAIDTVYGNQLRFFGYIPSGILITIFCLLAPRFLNKSALVKVGFVGMTLFYGVTTIIVGIFPCDSGCNKQLIDPSISQIIHNLAGFFTYLFVPISMLIIGIGLLTTAKHRSIAWQGILSCIIGYIFVFVLFSNQSSAYIGLYQRVIEIIFAIWLIQCTFSVKNKQAI